MKQDLRRSVEIGSYGSDPLRPDARTGDRSASGQKTAGGNNLVSSGRCVRLWTAGFSSMMRVLRSFNFFLVVVLLVIAAAYWIRYSPELPARIPVHFNGQAEADAWSSPQGFAHLYWEVILGISGIFILASLLLQIVPPFLVHIPRRDYWFDDRRQRRTREDLAQSLLGFCAITLALFLVIFHLTVRSAIEGSGHLSGQFNWVTGAYLVFVALWTGRLLWHYSRVPGGGEV